MNINAVYVEGIAAFQTLRDNTKGSLQKFKNSRVVQRFQDIRYKSHSAIHGWQDKIVDKLNRDNLTNDYSHIYRRKKWWELVRISGAVCGIEFCYAAETAFVSPILLSLGVNVKYMTLIWCLSPLIGFFLTPVLGSLSDSCTSRLGRRRPFIILLSIGIILGLIFVPNGKDIGFALGDVEYTESILVNTTEVASSLQNSSAKLNETAVVEDSRLFRSHPWGVVFTIFGTVILDFCSDSCQSPCRTYLLDVTSSEDHAIGLGTFTVMAGLGGSVGYAMGGVDWDSMAIGKALGGHIHAVFTIVACLFVVCLLATITSFREIPLDVLLGDVEKTQKSSKITASGKYDKFTNEDDEDETADSIRKEHPELYGSLEENTLPVEEEVLCQNCLKHTSDASTLLQNGGINSPHDESIKMNAIGSDKGTDRQSIDDHIIEDNKNTCEDDVPLVPTSHPSLREYLRSIIFMPYSLRILCLTNLFSWMSLVCYSLYFTDFVGETVFGGDPTAPEESEEYQLYHSGVRFGCWGMCLYSLSCSVYSFITEKLVNHFGAKPVYIGGQLVYSIGMVIMAITRHKISVILLSTSAGIMYATLFTMPYLLVAHYHCNETFEIAKSDASSSTRQRGIGTDVAIVGSMVFLSQFILSSCMGTIVEAVKSSVATVCAAAILSFCGAMCATQVMYLNL